MSLLFLVPFNCIMLDDPMMKTALSIILMMLGLSFAYKCYLAAFKGKVWIWPGFLPITVVSPVFTHWPPTKKSFVKEVQSPWVHLIWGPFFFLVSLALMAWGADQLGLPGSQSINTILTLGKPDAPKALYFDTDAGTYRFPLGQKMKKRALKFLLKKVKTKKGQRLRGVEYDELPDDEEE